MRGTHLAALLACGALAATAGAFLGAAPALAQQGAAQQAKIKAQAEQGQATQATQPTQTADTQAAAAKAAKDPEVVATIKEAIKAQGDISPYTVKALQHDPLASDAIAKGRGGGSGQQGGQHGGQQGQAPRNTKAIYGDIIIHK